MIEPASNRIESAVESAELVDFESAEVESVEFAEAVSESAAAAVDFEAVATVAKDSRHCHSNARALTAIFDVFPAKSA